MASNKVLGDCPILLTECKTVRQAILMAVKKNIPRICIYSYSKVVVNAIRQIAVPKEIINLIEDARSLLS